MGMEELSQEGTVGLGLGAEPGVEIFSSKVTDDRSGLFGKGFV